MNNMDYQYCFKKGIYVIATSPVFSKPVAEIALGMTLSLLRNIHNAHLDFIKGKEKYGLESNHKASLLSGKKIGLIGFGDLAKSLYPLLLPFSKDINVYDPWIPKLNIQKLGFKSISLNKMFESCEVIYVLATVTTKNKHFIDKKTRVGPDISASMTGDEFKSLQHGANQIFLAKGDYKGPIKEEKSTIDFAFASLVATKNIKKGEILTKRNIFPRRPGTGDYKAFNYNEVLGKRAKNFIKDNTLLTVSYTHLTLPTNREV